MSEEEKRKPGRPRIHPIPDPDAPKRPRGRPRRDSLPPPVPGRGSPQKVLFDVGSTPGGMPLGTKVELPKIVVPRPAPVVTEIPPRKIEPTPAQAERFIRLQRKRQQEMEKKRTDGPFPLDSIFPAGMSLEQMHEVSEKLGIPMEDRSKYIPPSLQLFGDDGKPLVNEDGTPKVGGGRRKSAIFSPTDTHRSKFIIRLPEEIRPTLEALVMKNERPMTVEVQRAIVAYARAEGVEVLDMTAIGRRLIKERRNEERTL